ncbi:GNAT family N-acetyltransferase [Aestuariibacter sp. AA17]|uniref:GNAT family N-acetyltransferase n=1 Tax=Fluctibacter corallii TaxID=2984329 RepID=A0ABT3ABI4_9ALTE|nr:GNAT family N-acetyltransferase [Aestuariibacter sp. AA17]MCV2886030.1 GNAT family N-acetyltransferase [Aestuariibacter sp. AA17]
MSKDNYKFVAIALYNGDRLVALAPFKHEAVKVKPTTLYSLSNYYSPIYDILFDQAAITRTDAFKQILKSESSFFSQFDTINLQPLCEKIADDLLVACHHSHFRAKQYDKTENWTITLDSQAPVQSHFSSKINNTVRRKSKKLSNTASCEYKIFTKTDHTLDKAISDYDTVYKASWKKNEPYPEFIDNFLKIAAGEGWLRMGILYVNGLPAAAQVWFVEGNEAYIFKLAYDPKYKTFSVGTLLTAHLFEHVFNEGVTVVDFLTGDDSYKKDWMKDVSHMSGLHLANRRTVYGQIEILKSRLASLIKQWRAG